MFFRISQNCEHGFRLNFLYGQGGHPTLFWNKEKGGFLDEIWHIWPLKIGGVGDKHTHDSDHAECLRDIILCSCFIFWLSYVMGYMIGFLMCVLLADMAYSGYGQLIKFLLLLYV